MSSHHRYYDPQLCRWINADEPENLGANGEFISHNLFAYCENNPVNGYDPDGSINWEGVIAGVALVAVAVVTVATFGTALPVLATVAVAAVATTGAVTTYAAATEKQMVVDVSASRQVLFPSVYAKTGTSLIFDFSKSEVYKYDHAGGGMGTCCGLTYSVGIVSNYSDPYDYSKWFYDINAGNIYGGDFCFTPKDSCEELKKTTNAKSITFTFPFLPGSGVGVDYYSKPVKLFTW